MRYLDWAQTVLRAVLSDRPAYTLLTIPKLAEELGLSFGSLPDAKQNEVTLSIDHVLTDLAPHGLVRYESGGRSIGYPPSARRFRVELLSSTWYELWSGYLEAEDEDFLFALAGLSEQPSERSADVASVPLANVFAVLGWDWDITRAIAVHEHLADRYFVQGRLYGGSGGDLRITYAGLVRALDETGVPLREAAEHLQARRLRAAGCLAAVELERRLKQLVMRPPKVSRRRDPSLEDYNQASFAAGIIDQETWESVSTIAVIRKRCVHALEREPEVDEVRLLLEGVERILRRYPSPLRVVAAGTRS